MGEAQHSPGRILLYVVAFLIFAGTAILNYLHMYGVGLGVIFISEATRYSNLTVELEVDDLWYFSLFTVSYAYQLVWLLFLVPTTFFSTPDGASYKYVDPGLFSPAFYIIFILACGCDVASLFLWDRGYFDYSLIPVGLTAFFLYLCIGVLSARVHAKGKLMMKGGMSGTIWATWMFAHNALAFWAASASLITLGHMGILLAHRFDIEIELTSTIVLACVGFEVLVYFLLDTTVLDKFLRYVYTPYMFVIFILVGMILHSFEPLQRSTIMTVALLGGTGALFVGKVMLSVWRCFISPLTFSSQPSERYEDTEARLSSSD